MNTGFEYRKSSRPYGVIAVFLWGAVLGALGLACWQFPALRTEQPDLFHTIWIIGGGTGVICLALSVYYICLNRDFVFRVSSDLVECISPSKRFGANYVLPMLEVAAIEECSNVDGPECWYLLDHLGRRFPIPRDFDNPVHSIVAVVQQLKTGIPKVRRPSSDAIDL